MNLKNLLRLSLVLILFTVVFSEAAYAQYFVNSQIGSDGRNGLSATIPVPDDGITGPKLTLTNAIAAAVAGQNITVAATPVNYNEAIVILNKALTINASGGTPVFANATLQVDADVTFNGPFSFNTLDLNTAGADLVFTGGSLTITGNIDVDNATSTFTGTLVASGAANTITYSVAYTTANEFPSSGIDNFAIDAAVAVSVVGNKTITDDITLAAGATMNINATTFAITDALAANNIAVALGAGASITGSGTLSFTLLAAAGISGAGGVENLPHVTVTSVAAQTLTINATIEDVNNITAGGAASIAASNNGDIDNVTNNGSGAITTANNGDVNAVSLTGTGNITLNAGAAASSDVTGSVSVSGYGTLTWGANINAINVTGNVSLTTNINLGDAGVQTGLAQILFTDDPTLVTGSVTNSVDVTGASAAGNANDNNGLIVFGAVNNNVTIGAVLTDATGGPADNTGSSLDNVGNIFFNFNGGGANTFTAGTITNSSSFIDDATNSGIIEFTAVWDDPVTVGNVSNTSTSIAGNGYIDFNSAGLDDLTTGSISTSGATAASNANGASIELGNSENAAGSFTIDINGNVTNSRSVVGSDILITVNGNDNDLLVDISGGVANSGLSDILFDLEDTSPDDVLIGGVVNNSNLGTIDFAGLVNGTFSAGGISVSFGLVDLSDFNASGAGGLDAGVVNVSGSGILDASGINGGNFSADSFTLSGGTALIESAGADDVLINGNASFTNGTLNITGIDDIIITGAVITIGNASTNPTFVGGAVPYATAIVLGQPIPNVLQTVNIGANFPQWGGSFEATNPANIPTVSQFTGGNLRVLGNLVFNTAAVTNSILLDGAKIYIGDNTQAGTGGTFTNATGYTTLNDGRVVMSGSIVQNILDPVSNSIYFGAIEIDNNSGGGPAIIINGGGNGDNALFRNFFYLTEGSIEGVDVEFVSVNGSVPHIIRNAGSLNAAPTFTNLVDVTYIGLEKTTSVELPVATDKLRNLTVATTNHSAGGVQAGYGVISLVNDVTVNGTLTVNAKQTLFLNGNDVTMLGSTVNVNGTTGTPATFGAIASAPGDLLILGAAAGVTVNGPGYIPNVRVNDNSVGNVIMTNVAGIVDVLLGAADANRNDAGVPDVTTPDGDISFQDGAPSLGPSNLSVNFAPVAAVGNFHFMDLILTDDDDETFTLNSNTVMGGEFALGGGTVALGSNTLTVYGNDGGLLGMDGTAEFTGSGTLEINGDQNNNDIDFTVSGDPAIINVNTIINMDGGQTFELQANDDLIIDGNLTLVDVTVANGGPAGTTTVDLNDGSTLTLGGANVTAQELSAFTAVNILNDGLLILDAVAAPQVTFTSAAATAITNLQVDDNVVLAGPVAGGTLTVQNFTHTLGQFTIGSANLEVGTSYNRTGNGTYSGNGFFIWNSAAENNFNHGVTGFDITNIRFSQDAEIEEAGVINVTGQLHVNDANLILTAGKINIAVGGTVHVTENAGGDADGATSNNPLIFAGNANFILDGTIASYTVDTDLWPAAPGYTSAQNVEIGGTADVILGASRQINNLLLISNTGDLTWDSPQVLTLGNNIDVQRNNNAGLIDRDISNTAPVGGFVTQIVNLRYLNNNANINTDIEYSDVTTIGSLTLLDDATPGETIVTINDAGETITGVVTLSSTLNIDANTTFALQLTIPDESTVDIGPGVSSTVTFQNGVVVGIDGDAAGANGGEFDITAGSAIIPAGGLNVNGTMTSSGTTTVTNNVIIGASGSYTGDGTDVLTANGLLTVAGALNMDESGILNLNGGAVISGTVDFDPSANGPGTPWVTVNIPSASVNLTGSTLLNTNNATLNFTGPLAQTLTIPGAATFANLTLAKSNNQVLTITGGNVTVGGLLTLTHGILDAGDNNITVTLATAGGFITNPGYIRNPASVNDAAHVVSNLGMTIPAGNRGRVEYPVGSLSGDYRPAAITFTNANPTITTTTIFVGHEDGEPLGVVNLPLNGGEKFGQPGVPNMIGGKAPYAWVIRASQSMGAGQLFDLELNGTEINRPLDNVENLRIIRRFDGDVNVNAWFLQGNNANYSNIMSINVPNVNDTLLTVRNQNSQGGIVTQAAIFTIGIPTQPPVFTGTLPADANVNEGATYTFDYNAQDLDANPSALVYSIQSVSPALPAPDSLTINATTGVLTFKPGFNFAPGAYTITVKVAKANDPNSFVTDVVVLTVINVNQAPVFTSVPNDTTITNAQVLVFDYNATDADGQTVTYSLVSVVPPLAGTAVVAPSTGILTLTPAFADAGKTVVVTVRATDGVATVDDITSVTITQAALRGDADGDGFITPNDASRILQISVGLATAPAAIDTFRANADQDPGKMIIPFDAYYVLWYLTHSNTWPTLAKISPASGIASFGNLNSDAKNNMVSLPISLTNVSNVVSAQIEINVDEKYADVKGVSVNLPEGWLSVSNYADGKLRIVMTGMNELKNGDLAVVNFRLKDKEAKFEVTGNVALNNDFAKELTSSTVKLIPSQFELSQNYPNPFNPATKIKYQLASDSKVTLTVYDMLGQKVASVVNAIQEAGYYTVEWNGSNDFGQKVTSGVYIYRLQAGDFVKTMKMNLLK